ncbi:MAG TPA: LamG-like jellyroll fold domain-containing protein [Xanthobacteraceae bacterium]|nr:LamG-like jellyroll fold domain-containing protein [Xanthobacteraceae bacterium]
MSTTLHFLIPIGLLAVAWSLCFVGCVLNTSGQGVPYSNQILAEAGLVAYWPLGDPEGSAALDLTGNHSGGYVIPPAYPAVPQSVQIANPALNLHQASIVPGDISVSGEVDKNLFPGCADFEGGYVSIPWSTQNSPTLTEFTLEAWIKPSWTGTGFLRVVFGAFVNNTGIVIHINQNNQWQFTIGTGAAAPVVNTMVPVDLTATTYVAVTCDKFSNVSLWINPQSQSDTSNPPPPPPTWPASPTPTGYVAADPTQLLAIFIGAGANDQALRTQPGGTGAPLFPFQGRIQDVALYNVVLDGNKLVSHFQNGSTP